MGRETMSSFLISYLKDRWWEQMTFMCIFHIQAPTCIKSVFHFRAPIGLPLAKVTWKIYRLSHTALKRLGAIQPFYTIHVWDFFPTMGRVFESMWRLLLERFSYLMIKMGGVACGWFSVFGLICLYLLWLAGEREGRAFFNSLMNFTNRAKGAEGGFTIYFGVCLTQQKGTILSCMGEMW